MVDGVCHEFAYNAQDIVRDVVGNSLARHVEAYGQPGAIGELGVFSDIDRDPRERVITIAWYALVRPADVIGGDDADEAAWFSIDDLPSLAFDHHKILDAAMERLRRDIHFEPVGFELLDDTFTIPDLQRLYEIILGVKFDRRNFQKKFLSSGIITPVAQSEEERKSPHAPIQYRFNEAGYVHLREKMLRC